MLNRWWSSSIVIAALVCAASGANMAHAQFSENFDFGNWQGWGFDAPMGGVGWGMDASPGTFPSGVSRSGSSLNYNNGTDYGGGCNGGGAITPIINITGVAGPMLQFWCNYNTETRSTTYDRRSVQIWNAAGTTMITEWQLASVGYTFNRLGGITGVGPGPCGEAYTDLETGAPVTAWHVHQVHLDPAWGQIRIRFVFWTVDSLRNGYAGWAIDDMVVGSNPTGAPTAWPDNSPDTTTLDGDGNELDICQRVAGNLLRWSWGCSNHTGDPGVHMIIGNNSASILHESFMYFDTNHGHYHMSQYSDFSLYRQQAFGLQKVARGPKRSYCLTDIDQVGAGPSISPGCNDIFQAISYNWQDVYALGTSGQEINVAGLPTGVAYYLIGIIDPLNRLRETNEMNQTDQIQFTLNATTGQVPIINRVNPFPPTATALTITSATVGTFQGVPAVNVIGTGFDTTLIPVMYDVGTAVAEAPMFTIVSTTSIWVNVPMGITTPGSIDLIRARGDATSFRIGAGAPVACPAPGLPTLGVPGGGGSTGRDNDDKKGPAFFNDYCSSSVPGGLMFQGVAMILALGFCVAGALAFLRR